MEEHLLAATCCFSSCFPGLFCQAGKGELFHGLILGVRWLELLKSTCASSARSWNSRCSASSPKKRSSVLETVL